MIRLCILSLLFFSFQAHSQSRESKIKALFILKFVENVSWPQERKDLVVGVIGQSDIFDELNARLSANNPNGIVIKKISASEAAFVDAVYVPSREDDAIHVISSNVSGKSVLIISESDLSRKGSGISFIEVGGRMNFIINKNAIESRGLKISGSLLALGKQV